MQDVKANGAPSMRPKTGPQGLMLYPVVVEYNLSTADFTRMCVTSCLHHIVALL